MKIRDITVDARENDEYDELDDDPIPYVYVRYTDSEVNSYIEQNLGNYPKNVRYERS